MASIKFHLDIRKQRIDLTYPLKIGITNKHTYFQIAMDINLTENQWNEQLGKVVQHPNKDYLNNYLEGIKITVQTQLLELRSSGRLEDISTKELNECIRTVISGQKYEEKKKKISFFEYFQQFADSKTNPRTKSTYQYTLSRIRSYSKIDILTFEDINYNWLNNFNRYLAKTCKVNSRSVHMRNIRAVFNDAINSDMTSNYPFRKFKIRSEETVKRSLTIDELIAIRDYPCNRFQRQYVDIFMLIFYLIGINIIDLCGLRKIVNGRIEYRRAKTGKLYSIKVEPEAERIIRRYKGKRHLINILDRYSNYQNYMHRLNNNLHTIKPGLTTYYARHTWATIAYEIGVEKDIISQALGHEFGSKITDIYIDYDRKKVDEANRKVIDYVNQHKK